MENFIPVLSAGSHAKPSQGACIMEMVSFLAGEAWSDTPECSNNSIAVHAQIVNDTVEDRNRHLLLKDFDRLFGTAIETSEDKINFSRALHNSRVKLDNLTVEKETVLSRYKFYEKDPTEYEDAMDEEIANCLTEALDIYDEMFGRNSVEPQDLSKLKELSGAI